MQLLSFYCISLINNASGIHSPARLSLFSTVVLFLSVMSLYHNFFLDSYKIIINDKHIQNRIRHAVLILLLYL